jgi:hypothetical protein
MSRDFTIARGDCTRWVKLLCRPPGWLRRVGGRAAETAAEHMTVLRREDVQSNVASWDNRPFSSHDPSALR